MFERDKAELREMGVPLETGRDQRVRHRARLPHRPRRLRAARDPPDREEAAAVGLARGCGSRPARRRRAQRPGASCGPPASTSTAPATIPLEPRLDAGEPAFEPCYAAARDRRRSVRLPAPRRGRPRPPPRAALGRRVLARPLVPRSATTSTAAPRGCSGCPASSAPRRRPAPPAPSSRRPDSTSPTSSPARSGERSTGRGPARPGTATGCAGTPRRWARADDGDDRLALRTTEPGQLADQLAAFGADVDRRVARRGARGRDRAPAPGWPVGVPA